MEINGIDFGWPTHARVAKVRLKAPAGRARSRGRRLDQRAEAVYPGPEAGQPRRARRRRRPRRPRSRDRSSRGRSRRWISTSRRSWSRTGTCASSTSTTQPPFSQDISKLSVTVKDLSNKASQRANLLVQALIGGDSTLDIRGELSAIGAPTYVDMVGELKKLALPAANPYMDGMLGWIIRRGELTDQARVQDRGREARRQERHPGRQPPGVPLEPVRRGQEAHRPAARADRGPDQGRQRQHPHQRADHRYPHATASSISATRSGPRSGTSS